MSIINCPLPPVLNSKPWAYRFSLTGETGSTISTMHPRPEIGWSMDFVFNKSGHTWSDGSVFYYVGVRGEDNPALYADNNLSFQFTPDGKIKWVAIRYSGDTSNCDSGYTRTYYTSSGETPTLFIGDDTNDFYVTIVFKRYKELFDCDLLNEGGINDLISGTTVLNPTDVITGATPIYDYTQVLNPKWDKERSSRLGTLKIYLNGRLLYKVENWEEIIPRNGGSIQPYIESWGGGTGLMNNVHNGICCFDIKLFRSFRQTLDFMYVKYIFNVLSSQYNFYIYGQDNCVDNLIGLTTQGLLMEDGQNLLSENNELMLY
jgi:hypothetical protein